MNQRALSIAKALERAFVVGMAVWYSTTGERRLSLWEKRDRCGYPSA